MASITHGNWTEGGVRPGYFYDRYSQIHDVCLKAIEWNVRVIVC